MSHEWCDIPEAVPGWEPDLYCDWCGCIVYDKDAEIVGARRFCADGCVDEYRRDIAIAVEDLAEEDADG